MRDHIVPYDNAHKPKLYRFYETLPGIAIWGTLVLAVALSFTAPHIAMVLVIMFDLYWLVRVLYYIYNIITAWRSYRASLVTDWPRLLAEIPGWRDVWHVVLLPNYAEPLEVMEATFTSLAQTAYPKDRIIVVLAGEEREGHPFLEKAAQIRDRFGSTFAELIVTIHPKGLPSEIDGKGANAAWAGKKIQEHLDERCITYDQVILSYFDIDTCVHPNYFAALTHTFLNHPNRLRTSYQPIALYNNNIWESSAITRVAAFGTTFWLFTELARPHRLFTFSSHAMPFRALVDVGFWQKDVVTDDTRIFLQCLLHYDGDYRVTPLYIPVSMDTATGGGRLHSLVNLYKQQRRWAWGVEHVPYLLWNFRRAPEIPFRKKFTFLWNLGEGMYSWATAPLLIFILGRLPLVVAQQETSSSILLFTTPTLLRNLMDFAMIGILVSAILSLTLLPKCPHAHPLRRIPTYAGMVLQWALLPITLIIFGSLPAIEAQTRLALGRYLGFSVTKKGRLKNDQSLRYPDAKSLPARGDLPSS